MAAKKTAEFMIVNRRSKKALQATGLENGLVVEQSVPTGSDAQLWTAVETDGIVKLVNKASGKVLDVMSEGTENGTWAQTWEDVGGGSQQWQFVKVTATYKKVLNIRSGKVLDIVDMSDEDGAPAQIWEDVDGAGQQWKLVSPEKVSAPVKKATRTAAVKKAPAAKKDAAPKKTAAKAAAPKAAAKKAAEAAKQAPVKTAAKKEAKPKTPAAVKAGTKKTAGKTAEKK